jgi:hypothetical protein
MKYVVLRERTTLGLHTVVFCVAPITHADLAEAFASTHTPVSAGFCRAMPGNAWQTYGASISLDLSPAAGDALLITAAIRVTARSAA